jgi:ATP phosphoribosyltransferase
MTTLESLEIPSQPFTVIVAKNRGLSDQVGRVLGTRSIPVDAEYVRVRGEDVPMLADELGRAGRQVLAITGDDLVDEWLAAGNALNERVSRDRVAWSDPLALYGAPALCLIERAGAASEPRAGIRRVAVCARYRSLAERFMRSMRYYDLELESILVTGEVETMVATGVADFAIDIVLTGKTLERMGLCVKRVISTSDVAVLEVR